MLNQSKTKIIRAATVSLSLNILLKGQLAFLNNHFHIVAVSGYDKNMQEMAEREGVEFRSVPMQRPIAPLKDLVSLWRLYQCFRKEKPSIVHSITPKAGLLCMTAAYFACVPIRIHTFTGLIFPYKKGMMQKLLIAMDKLLCLFATNIYPEGNGVKNDLIKYNITSKPLQVLANGNINGINTEYFDPQLFTIEEKNELRTRLAIGSDDFVFLFVGRLVGDKGINELVAAFEKLHKQYANTKLILVGPKEKTDPLTNETELLLQQNKSIICTGFLPDVRPYMAITNVLVFPSYREGFPNVLIQAGAMNLPSIVTDISGCNEIIIDGKNGIIIPAQNTDALFSAMHQFVSDQSLIEKLSRNARPMIEERYRQELVWNALLSEYTKLIKA